MKPNARLAWSLAMILGSILFAGVIWCDNGTPKWLLWGYLFLLGAVFLVVNVWKKPHE